MTNATEAKAATAAAKQTAVDANKPPEDPFIAAMRAANPYYDEDLAAYEGYHRRLAEKAAAETTAAAEVRAVQVHPIEPTLKAPGTMRLILQIR